MVPFLYLLFVSSGLCPLAYSDSDYILEQRILSDIWQNSLHILSAILNSLPTYEITKFYILARCLMTINKICRTM
jgi:hypothetical protein